VIGQSNDNLGGIAPFLSHLHSITLESLTLRPDFPGILKAKYSNLNALPMLPVLLEAAITHLTEALQKAKSQLLDHKPVSIKQLFKLYERVDTSLKSAQSELEFLSSDIAHGILQDVVEVYLGHLYDASIKR